ncbi:MAG: hypothetical protein GY745_01890 [Actinomycetia bacterium]|nr:hypothetical protein [Actinomycetes bacterium]MCP4083800.1 hypothetical protein [Actinomycetes bacterium]
MSTPETHTNTLAWAVAGVVVFGWGVNFVLAKHALRGHRATLIARPTAGLGVGKG